MSFANPVLEHECEPENESELENKCEPEHESDEIIKTDYNLLVYKNDSIAERMVDNFKSVVALDDIPKGTLLMLEHGLAAGTLICHRILQNNAQLFDRYHPRTINHADASPEDRAALAIEKISHNCFGLGNGNKLLNIYVQGINHSCTANCAVYVRINHTCKDTAVVFMEVYSVRDIESGSQITINYGPETAHTRDFECGCGMDIERRRKIASITSSVVRTFATSKENTEIANRLTHAYLTSLASKKMLLNQYLAVNGIYINKNSISAYDEKGLDIINSVIHRYLGVDPESLVTSDGNRIDNTMTPQKLKLFIDILNHNLLTEHKSVGKMADQ